MQNKTRFFYKNDVSIYFIYFKYNFSQKRFPYLSIGKTKGIALT